MFDLSPRARRVILVLFALLLLELVVLGILLFPHPSPASSRAQTPPTTSASPSLPPSPSPSPSATDAALPAAAGKIYFVCQIFAMQLHDQICVMNPDGSDYHRLTFDDYAENYYPSPAPDGKSLVYASNRSGSYEIYELVLTSGARLQLTHGLGEVAGPAISPDGMWIVFADNIGRNSRIWLMGRDGSNPHQIYANPGVDSLDPTWSPDGTRILFASGLDTDKRLYTINPDGTDLRLVNADFRTRGRASWSPDGKWIATYTGSPWTWSMVLVAADGSGVTPIPVGGVALAPAFSPDGQWIVFTGYLDNPNNPDGCEIYRARPDGSQITRLTYNNYCDWQPRWSP